jgi:hypothetical protein
MITPEELEKKKNPICMLCTRPFALPGLESRFGGGRRLPDGTFMCNLCIRDKGENVVKRYQNKNKRFLTEGERLKIINSKTVR